MTHVHWAAFDFCLLSCRFNCADIYLELLNLHRYFLELLIYPFACIIIFIIIWKLYIDNKAAYGQINILVHLLVQTFCKSTVSKVEVELQRPFSSSEDFQIMEISCDVWLLYRPLCLKCMLVCLLLVMCIDDVRYVSSQALFLKNNQMKCLLKFL